MAGRWRILFRIASVTLCAGLAWFLFWLPNALETSYRWRRLDELARAWRGDSTTNLDEVLGGMRALALKNVSELVAPIAHDPNPRKKKLEALMARLPSRTREWLMRGPLADRKESRATTAQMALLALGPQAASAVPELVSLGRTTNLLILERVFFLMPFLGTNGEKYFLSAMEDQDASRQTLAVRLSVVIGKDAGTNFSSAARRVIENAKTNSDSANARRQKEQKHIMVD